MLRRLKSSLAVPLQGEIPAALTCDLPCELTTLSNSVRVASMPLHAPLSTIGIMIEAGSRNETMENTGVAHFLEHMHFKGTANRTRLSLESGVENMGGNLNAYTSREITLYQMQVFAGDEDRALETMRDMLFASKYEKLHIEREREVILREAEEVEADTRETVLEHVHSAAYRDHIIAQPILGSYTSILKISREQLKQFVYAHYVGPRVLVLGAGPVLHDSLVDIAEKHLGTIPVSTEIPIVGQDMPQFCSSTIISKDESLDAAFMGIFYPAPSWQHEDYWAFLLLQRLMGDYDPSKKDSFNHPHLQYNYLHKYLGGLEDLTLYESLYIPYKDCGLFGHYVSSSDPDGSSVLSTIMTATKRLSSSLTPHEVFKAKNRLYNELLQIENGSDLIQTLGSQLIYMGRRVPRSEIATRIASMDVEYLQGVLGKWLWDSQMALALLGPLPKLRRSLGLVT